MAGCRSASGGGRWSTRSRRRSRSWSIARAAGSVLIKRTRSWSRWGIRVRSARPAGRWRRPSVGWRQKHGRRTRPWIPEPGLWLQWDYGDGPVVTGSRTVLFCAWLAWSRYRVVVPLRDKTLPSVVIGLDRALRRFDGVPTYALTDNEKTVTVDHVCGIAVRNPTIVEVSRHYGLTIATCEPADPQSKGGSEATVKIAKADLVPTDHNLREEYADFAAVRGGVRAVHGRGQHAAAPGHAPAAAGDARRRARAPAPAAEVAAHRSVSGRRARSTGSRRSRVGGAIYSVPHELVDERVWVRIDGAELIVVHVDGPAGRGRSPAIELTTPGPSSAA